VIEGGLLEMPIAPGRHRRGRTGTIDRYSTAPVNNSLNKAGIRPGRCTTRLLILFAQGGVFMDKIIRVSLGLLLVILIAAVSVFSYQAYVEKAYRESLTGTYSYTCTITTDSPLSNVTLFIPVPADRSGNSPVVAGFSTRDIAGIPDDGEVTLYDTGKATMVKVTVPAIAVPHGTTQDNPLAIRMSAELKEDTAIDTWDPVNNSALFRPVGELVTVPCPAGPAVQGSPSCYRYTTSLYADYGAAPGASVTISATLTGRNTWRIFEPGSNEYDTTVSLQMSGEQHGWSTMSGTLAEHIGQYDTPRITHS